MAFIEDRWLNKRKDPETGRRERTDRWGTGKRYRVGGTPGVRDRSFEALEDAKKWKAKVENETLTSEFFDPRAGNVTFADYVRKDWRPGASGDTKTQKLIDQRLAHLRAELGSMPLRTIEASTLRTLIKTLLEKPLAPSYVRSIMSTLSSIFEAAIDDKKIQRNPMRSKSVKVPPDTQERREAWPLHRVLNVRDLISPKHRLTVVLGSGCGLRQGEVLGLSQEDVDFDQGVIHVRRQVQYEGSRRFFRLPKGNKTRSVDMPDSVAEEVRLHMKEWPPLRIDLPWMRPDGETRQAHQLLLTTMAKTPQAFRANDWDTRIWKPVLAKAGVIPPLAKGAGRWQYEAAPRDGFHVLRHTYASMQLQAGESIVTLARWLGHSSPTVTLDHYAHFMPEAGLKGRAAVDKLLGTPSAS